MRRQSAAAAYPGSDETIQQLEADIDSHLQWYKQSLNGPPPGVAAASDAPPPHHAGPPPAPAAPPFDARAALAGMMDELRAMVGEEFAAQQRRQKQQLRELIEQEWQRRLPELDFAVRERHNELRQLFDENSHTALHIGNKVMEAEHTIDELRREVQDLTAWRQTAQQHISAVADEVADARGRREELRRMTDDLRQERETLGRRLQEAERAREEAAAAAARAEREMDRRFRPQIDELADKVERIAQERRGAAADGAEWRQRLDDRLTSQEEATRDSARDAARTASQLSRHDDELADLADDSEELRATLRAAEYPGFCGGCRLTKEDCDKKLFTVKESICFLDSRCAQLDERIRPLTGGGGAAPGGVGSPAAGGVVGAATERRLADVEAGVAAARSAADAAQRTADKAAQKAEAAERAATSGGRVARRGSDAGGGNGDGGDVPEGVVRRASIEVQAALIEPLSNRITQVVQPIREQVADLQKEVEALRDRIDD